jgi:exosome complex component RRP45
VSPAELERLLLKSLQGSNALDVESLVIVANSAAWHVNILVTVLDDDGALLDASSLAVLSALRAFRRPDVSIVDGVVRLLPLHQRVPVPVALNHHPVCVTFAVGATGDTVNPAILVDPTATESTIFPGYLVIAVNEHAQVAFVHQGGVGVELDPSVLLDVTAEAVKIAAARYAALVGSEGGK